MPVTRMTPTACLDGALADTVGGVGRDGLALCPDRRMASRRSGVPVDDLSPNCTLEGIER
jgi:hypothetical protein